MRQLQRYALRPTWYVRVALLPLVQKRLRGGLQSIHGESLPQRLRC